MGADYFKCIGRAGIYCQIRATTIKHPTSVQFRAGYLAETRQRQKSDSDELPVLINDIIYMLRHLAAVITVDGMSFGTRRFCCLAFMQNIR